MWYKRFGYTVRPRYSSAPAHLTARNGLNFSKSVGNPNSRLERVREYLRVNGPRSKREILQDVFNKEVGDMWADWKTRWENGWVSHGWGAYLFMYGVRHGFFTKTRRGNVTYWDIPR